jgi:hypothetical protein
VSASPIQARFGKGLLILLAALLAACAVLILALGAAREGHESLLRPVVAVGFALVLVAVSWTQRFWVATGLVVVASSLVLAGFAFVPARTDRDWAADQLRASYASFRGTRVTAHDVRDFRYRSTDDFDPHWYDAVYDTRELVKGYFVVEPFSGFYGAAHTFVSFRFRPAHGAADGSEDRFLAVSVETRRERGEHFSVLRGLLKNYELAYVAGDERDLIDLRVRFRHDAVYVYPVAASHEKLVAYFLDIMRRMTALRARPEFYDALRSNCTTNLAAHLERITDLQVPRLDRRLLLPADSDSLALELGLLDATGDLASLRRRFRVSPEVAAAAAGETNYSQRIRGE